MKWVERLTGSAEAAACFGQHEITLDKLIQCDDVKLKAYGVPSGARYKIFQHLANLVLQLNEEARAQGAPSAGMWPRLRTFYEIRIYFERFSIVSNCIFFILLVCCAMIQLVRALHARYLQRLVLFPLRPLAVASSGGILAGRRLLRMSGPRQPPPQQQQQLQRNRRRRRPRPRPLLVMSALMCSHRDGCGGGWPHCCR